MKHELFEMIGLYNNFLTMLLCGKTELYENWLWNHDCTEMVHGNNHTDRVDEFGDWLFNNFEFCELDDWDSMVTFGKLSVTRTNMAGSYSIKLNDQSEKVFVFHIDEQCFEVSAIDSNAARKLAIESMIDYYKSEINKLSAEL
jgi:hypothetical protein